MSPDLSSVIFSMFVGGSGTDAAHTIKLDQARNVFLAGGTTSLNFPVTAGAAQGMLSGDVDGWIAKVAASGNAIINATFTGRSNYDQIFFLDLDPHEDVYVFGQTTSPDFIKKPDTVFHEVNGGQFIQKFSNNLGSLMISTVFGAGRGVPDISPTAFLVNDCQNVFLAGWGGVLNNFNLGRPDWGKWTGSNTTGLTITAEALQKTTTGNDFYLMVLDRSLSNLLYATWLGGKQSVTHVDGGTSRFDKNGIVYQAVCSSCGGFDNDFPTTPGAHSRTNNSNNCNNLAFKLDLSSLKAIIQPNSLQLNMPGITNICFPDTLMFENLSLGGERYLWDMGDGRQFATDNQKPFQYFYKQPGIYTVWLKAVDAGTCKIRDSTFVKITVDRVEAVVSDDVTICENTSALLHASGAATYAWTSEDGTFQATGPDVTVSPGQQTDYYVSMTDDNSDCILKDTITVDVIPLIVPEFDVLSNGECTPVPAITVRSTTVLEEGDQFYIDFGDGYTADTEIAEHTYEHDGVYTVKLVGIRDFCVSEKIISVPAFRLRVPNVITPEVKDGINDTFKVLFGNEGMVKPGDFGFNVSLTVYNRWGRKLYHAYPYNNDWNADGLEPGIYFFELKVDRYTFCKSWLEVIR
jgi:PKD repeat protein